MNIERNSLLPTPLAEAPGQHKLSRVSEEISDALVKHTSHGFQHADSVSCYGEVGSSISNPLSGCGSL